MLQSMGLQRVRHDGATGQRSCKKHLSDHPLGPGTQPAFGVGIYSREESLKTILNAKKLKVLCIEKNSYGTKESIAGKNI